MPSVQKSFKSNEKKTKTNCFRYHEFLDGSFFGRFKRSLTEQMF